MVSTVSVGEVTVVVAVVAAAAADVCAGGAVVDDDAGVSVMSEERKRVTDKGYS